MTLTAFFCCSFGLILLKKTTNPAKRSWVYLNEKVEETYGFFCPQICCQKQTPSDSEG